MIDISNVGWYVSGIIGAGLVGVVWAVWAMSKRTIHVEQHNIQHNEPHIETAPTGGGLGIAPVLIKWAVIALVVGFALVAIGNAIITIGNNVSAGLSRLGDDISRTISAPAAQPAALPQPIVQPMPTAVPITAPAPVTDAPQTWQYVVLAIVLAMCAVMMVAVLLVARRTQPTRLERAAAQLPPLSYTGRIIEPRAEPRASQPAPAKIWEDALEKIEF